METTMNLSTAKAVCNDNKARAWEVRAIGSDGKWWTVSDRTDMSYNEARSQASDMRHAANLDA